MLAYGSGKNKPLWAKQEASPKWLSILYQYAAVLDEGGKQKERPQSTAKHGKNVVPDSPKWLFISER